MKEEVSEMYVWKQTEFGFSSTCYVVEAMSQKNGERKSESA